MSQQDRQFRDAENAPVVPRHEAAAPANPPLFRASTLAPGGRRGWASSGPALLGLWGLAGVAALLAVLALLVGAGVILGDEDDGEIEPAAGLVATEPANIPTPETPTASPSPSAEPTQTPTPAPTLAVWITQADPQQYAYAGTGQGLDLLIYAPKLAASEQAKIAIEVADEDGSVRPSELTLTGGAPQKILYEPQGDSVGPVVINAVQHQEGGENLLLASYTLEVRRDTLTLEPNVPSVTLNAEQMEATIELALTSLDKAACERSYPVKLYLDDLGEGVPLPILYEFVEPEAGSPMRDFAPNSRSPVSVKVDRLHLKAGLAANRTANLVACIENQCETTHATIAIQWDVTACEATAKSMSNLREQATKDSPVVQSLSGSTTVQAVGYVMENDTEGWYRVFVGDESGQEGWISHTLLTFTDPTCSNVLRGIAPTPEPESPASALEGTPANLAAPVEAGQSVPVPETPMPGPEGM